MARYSRLLLVALGVLSLPVNLGCRDRGAQATEMPPAATEDTKLSPGDVFVVRVFGEEALSGKHQVAADGTIDFPLLGTVQIAGLEPTDVADKLQGELREQKMLRDPHVSVYVEKYASRRVSVVGAVANPGAFPLEPGMTVVQAISMAGGFSSLADRDATVVTRRVDDKTVRYRVPVERVTRGQAADVEVAAGDIIFVPERLF
ncbi:MAG: polysaccharide biosynthesis/export family protein [Myxococcota bacterium]